MSRQLLYATTLALLSWIAVRDLLAADLPDFTQTPLESLGIKLVAPKIDSKTGFLVGGTNPTALIHKLTEIAGRPVADLEADMRPGGLSTKGFLGKDEHLLDVLAADNETVVKELGLSHQELARHLHLLGAVAAQHAATMPADVTYHGKTFRLRATLFRRHVKSPFEDGTKTNGEATIENLATGKKMSYSRVVPHLIERYGFYEGKGTPYRVEPRTVVEVLDFLKVGKGR